jgi:hypothetical protein
MAISVRGPKEKTDDVSLADPDIACQGQGMGKEEEDSKMGWGEEGEGGQGRGRPTWMIHLLLIELQLNQANGLLKDKSRDLVSIVFTSVEDTLWPLILWQKISIND